MAAPVPPPMALPTTLPRAPPIPPPMALLVVSPATTAWVASRLRARAVTTLRMLLNLRFEGCESMVPRRCRSAHDAGQIMGSGGGRLSLDQASARRKSPLEAGSFGWSR
ncbi:hypothetical protein D3C85_1641810 [compost metagenome]